MATVAFCGTRSRSACGHGHFSAGVVAAELREDRCLPRTEGNQCQEFPSLWLHFDVGAGNVVGDLAKINVARLDSEVGRYVGGAEDAPGGPGLLARPAGWGQAIFTVGVP